MVEKKKSQLKACLIQKIVTINRIIFKLCLSINFYGLEIKILLL
jgi:hypothetical protein